MLPAKRLLFLECPPLSHDVNTWIFRQMGFDVKVHQILCSDLDSILDIESKYQLADFDAIPVVGMNLNISGEKQQAQADVFGGVFISGDFNDEQVREMFRGLAVL
jgi:hypothetical protein